MPETQEAQQLRRRARRRLVGAIALVLFLVIVPPMVMDLEPKPVPTDLTVEIPRQEAARLKTPPPAPAPEARPAPAERAAKAPAEKAGQQAASEPPKTETAKAPAKVAAVDARKSPETERIEAILKGESFVIPLGAYANPDNVKQLQSKLAKAGVNSFTEPAKAGAGAQTRVAAGPYTTREEAERVREQLAGLKDLGVVPGTVATRQ